MRLMVEYFDYMRYENKHFSAPSFLDISASLHDLDSIGSIGRNLCVYYNETGDKDALPIIDTLLAAMEKKIPRFEDGTFHRHNDMWADDTFMSCPFLVEAGILKNDEKYHREAIRQLLGFKKRLYMADEKIFSHIFFLNTQRPTTFLGDEAMDGYTFRSRRHSKKYRPTPKDTASFSTPSAKLPKESAPFRTKTVFGIRC